MADDDDFISDEVLNSSYDMEPVSSGSSAGLCVIFNSITFDSDCWPTREGSKKDATRIKDVFGDTLGFEVKELKDKTKEQMKEEMEKIAGAFKKDWRCFVCFFLSHGVNADDLIDYKGQRVNVRIMMDLVDGENSPKMKGKPKLFFVQMCRGYDREEYLRTYGYDAAGDVPDVDESEVTNKSCRVRDRLVCYATPEKHMAPIDPKKGSAFVQTLTSVLKSEKCRGRDIKDVLRMVTLIIDRNTDDLYKVCPVYDSTLAKTLVLRPKEMDNNVEGNQKRLVKPKEVNQSLVPKMSALKAS